MYLLRNFVIFRAIREINGLQTSLPISEPFKTSTVGSSVHCRVLNHATTNGDHLEGGEKMCSVLDHTVHHTSPAGPAGHHGPVYATNADTSDHISTRGKYTYTGIFKYLLAILNK